MLFAEAAEHAAKAGAAAEEAGGFVIGKLQRVFFRDIDAADLLELQQFAFDHLLCEINENVEDVEITFLQGDLKGLHVEPVAGEDAAMIAPTGIGGGAAAAGVRGVDDIVVNQGGAVEEFDDSGKFNSALAVAFASGSIAMGKEKQCGAKALPSSTKQIACDFGDRLIGGGALAREFLLDLDEVFAHQFKNLSDGQ